MIQKKLALTGWYGNPVAAEDAVKLQSEIKAQLQAAFKSGADVFSLRVHELIAGFWLDKPIEPFFEKLLHLTHDPEQKAILNLVVGQLLISSKLNGALDYLNKGFEIATPLLTTADYFLLQKRHSLLSSIKCRRTPQPARTLEELLDEARIIEKLRTTNPLDGLIAHKNSDLTG